jgi:hypothetical protein
MMPKHYGEASWPSAVAELRTLQAKLNDYYKGADGKTVLPDGGGPFKKGTAANPSTIKGTIIERVFKYYGM